MAILSRLTAAQLLDARKAIAVIAPHPDDEVFGCGLLIAAARRRGVRLVIIVLTDGQASHPNSERWPPARLLRLRRSETRRGLARLGASNAVVRFMGWRDGCLSSEGCPLRLRRTIIEHGVGRVMVSSPRDFHADHQAAFALTVSATRGLPVDRYTYAVWSRIDDGKRASDIALNRKRWAARAHRSQLGGYIQDDPSAFTFDTHAFDALVNGREVYERIGSRSKNGGRGKD